MSISSRPGAALTPLLAFVLCAGAFPEAYGAAAAAPGRPAAGELHFTTSLSTTQSVRKVQYAYDGATTLSVPEPTPLAKAPKSMGIVKAKDGNLVAAGGGANVAYAIDLGSANVASQAGPWVIPRSIALEPSEAHAWIADSKGSLFRMQAGPMAAPVRMSVLGAEKKIHYLAFRDAHTAFYSAENDAVTDSAYVGLLDTRTMTATRWMTLPGEVTSMVLDPYTESLILCGTNFLVQVDTATRSVASLRVLFREANIHSCVADGEGHLLMADYSGELHLMDYSKSRLLADSTNLWAKQFVLEGLGHLAPLTGPGAIKVKPPAMKGLKAVYADADGDGRIDNAVVELPKPSIIPPSMVSLRDPVTGLPRLFSGRIDPVDGTRFRLAFPDSQMAFGTTFVPGPYASVLEDTSFFDRAPFEVRDGVGPQLLSAEAIPPQRSGDRPLLRLAFSEALKVDASAKTLPLVVLRNGADAGMRMTLHGASHLGGNVWQFAFASADFPQGGDSVVVIEGTPQLTDEAGNASNQKRKVPVVGVPPPVFALAEGLPRLAGYAVPAGAPPAGILLAVDDARPGECLNCPPGPVETAFEAALQAPARPGFQPWLFAVRATGPFRYDLAFYTNLGEFINRARGSVDESHLARVQKDKDGVGLVRLYWWPVTEAGSPARTGAYIGRGVLSADALVRPSPQAPGTSIQVPAKAEKVSVTFGRL